MATESARLRELFAHRALRSLLLAELVDVSGSWAFNTVFAAVLYGRTGSAAWISAGLAARWVPALLLGPIAGVIADRYDRGRVMVCSAGASATLMALLAVLVGRSAPIGVLLAVSAVQACLTTAYNPAFGASLPDIVPERLLSPANSLREVGNNAGVLAGPAIGTVFLLAGDPAWALGLNAVTYLVPLAVVIALRIRSAGSGATESGAWREFRDGVSALLRERTATVLVLMVALDSGVAGVVTALALPIALHAHIGGEHYGYLLIASSAGSVAAAGLASRLAGLPRLTWVVVGALLAQTVPLAVLAVVTTQVPAYVLVLITGAGMIVVDIVGITALQRDVAREYLGRVFGMLDTALLAFNIVAVSVCGVLVAAVGLTPVLVAVGLGVPVVVFACVPVFRAMDTRTADRARRLEPVVALLEHLDLFTGADRPTLERLAIAADPVALPAGAVVLREGEPAEDLWLLAAGTLAVRAEAVGQLPEVTAPGYVGEIGVLHHRPRTATVTAAVDCTLYRLPGTEFENALSGRVAGGSLLRLSEQRLARTEGEAPARRPRPYRV